MAYEVDIPIKVATDNTVSQSAGNASNIVVKADQSTMSIIALVIGGVTLALQFAVLAGGMAIFYDLRDTQRDVREIRTILTQMDGRIQVLEKSHTANSAPQNVARLD